VVDRRYMHCSINHSASKHQFTIILPRTHHRQPAVLSLLNDQISQSEYNNDDIIASLLASGWLAVRPIRPIHSVYYLCVTIAIYMYMYVAILCMLLRFLVCYCAVIYCLVCVSIRSICPPALCAIYMRR
jgi:hypothetical protein